MNDLNQIADLHNRRANLDVVANRAREHGFPLLAWPEDKLLLRIADLAAKSFGELYARMKKLGIENFDMTRKPSDKISETN